MYNGLFKNLNIFATSFFFVHIFQLFTIKLQCRSIRLAWGSDCRVLLMAHTRCTARHKAALLSYSLMPLDERDTSLGSTELSHQP